LVERERLLLEVAKEERLPAARPRNVELSGVTSGVAQNS
jgi:hypothetical protein